MRRSRRDVEAIGEEELLTAAETEVTVSAANRSIWAASTSWRDAES